MINKQQLNTLKSETYNKIIFLVTICITILLFTFSQTGVHNVYNDTSVYVNQILYYEGELTAGDGIQYHSFKPFYGIVGSLLYPALSPYGALLAINIALYIGFIIITFLFLKKLQFSEEESFIGATWVATGYPLLKYGLALLTDISGWFFAIATIYIFLIVRERGYPKHLLIITSIIGFIGSLCKETGLLGLCFAGIILFFDFFKSASWKKLHTILAISLPFLLLQGILYLTIVKEGKTAVDWIAFNITTNTNDTFHSFKYFIFTEGATFAILWIYALFGLLFYIKNKYYKKDDFILWVSLVLMTLPVLFWPLFYVRIFYIQFLFIIPLALLGYKKITNNKGLLYTYFVIFLPITISVILYSIAGKGSLFDILSFVFK
ncbi:MAG: hypothetical protein RLZZ308_152 [Candidatus Parcubacteria bacterium]|jgi:hypothetical protein